MNTHQNAEDATKSPVVSCDRCGQPFAIHNQVEYKDGGELQLFVCPHCNHRYKIAFVTATGLKLRNRLLSTS